MQPDSDRAPFAAGDHFESSEQLLARYSQDHGSGPLTVHAAIAAKLSSMSGYDKNTEQYVYGKCIAAQMTGLAGQMPQPGRMDPVEAHVRVLGRLTDHPPFQTLKPQDRIRFRPTRALHSLPSPRNTPTRLRVYRMNLRT